MTPAQRRRFDRILQRIIDALPPNLHRVIEEIPVVVLDRPTPAMLRDLGVPRDVWDEEASLLCGLHSGVALTERSVDRSAELPPDIHLFRQGIVEEAGGWSQPDDDIGEQIRITLLHEIGHHFGLDEDDLDRLGYA